MDGTKENYHTVLDQIESLLPTAAYVAIDEEMTGISFPRPENAPRDVFEKFSDVNPQRYNYMKGVAEQFNIIQFGVCLYHEVPSTVEGQEQQYEARAFNFYMFPETGMISMEADAIAFNRKCGMNFQKWIYEGVHYVNAAEEKAIRNDIKPDHTAKGDVHLEGEDLKWVKRQLNLLRGWVAKNKGYDYEAAERKGFSRVEDGWPVFGVEPCHAKLRLALRQHIDVAFPGTEMLVESKGRGDTRHLSIRLAPSPDDMTSLTSKTAERKEFRIQKKLGLRRLFNMLVAAKKPLIVHNGMFDILFMWAHFEGKLPATYSAFKTQLHELFPIIFDTKYLLSRPDLNKNLKQFKTTSLGPVWNDMNVEIEASAADEAAVRPYPLVTLAEGFRKYDKDSPESSDDSLHEAGYDAYLTGSILISLLSQLPASDRAAHKYHNEVMLFRALHSMSLGEEAKDKLVYENEKPTFFIEGQISDVKEFRREFDQIKSLDKHAYVYIVRSSNHTAILSVCYGNADDGISSQIDDTVSKVMAQQTALRGFVTHDYAEHYAAMSAPFEAVEAAAVDEEVVVVAANSQQTVAQ